jgi:hypothetical protein
MVNRPETVTAVTALLSIQHAHARGRSSPPRACQTAACHPRTEEDDVLCESC